MNKILEIIGNEKVEWKKLGDVSEITRGKVISKNYIQENPGIYPVYSSQTLNNGEIGRINSYDFEGECATWTTDGAYAGTVFYRNGKFSITNICGMITPKNTNYLLTKYIVYWLQIEAKKHVKDGSGNPKLMSNVMSKVQIPIPSLETQEKIVKILDTMVDHFTQLEAELEARNKQYEYYRDKLLSEEYLSKVIIKHNENSENYGIVITTLGEIAKVNRGASPRPIRKFITESVDGVPWIKISDTDINSKYVINSKQKITKEGAKKSRLLKKGDFIISNSMSYGRPYILDIEGCIHDGWASISDYENNLNSDFLYHYLNSDKVQKYWLLKMNSSSVSNLNSSIIESLPILIVPMDVQIRIAEILDKFQEITQDVSGLLPKEIELRKKQYEYYREKLLDFKRDDDE